MGDLEQNLGRIICEYMTEPKEELEIVSKLVKLSTTIDTLGKLWEEFGGTDQSVDLLYEPWVREHDRLRAFVTEHRDKIVLIIPTLENNVDVYLAPNPYQENDESDWGQAWKEFAYNQKVAFHNTLEIELGLL